MPENNDNSGIIDVKPFSELTRCIQCGTCSASCPLIDLMDTSPRSLFEMIRQGDDLSVLESNTPWYCVSCYFCTSRCPREIPVTDIMYRLKQIAIESGREPKNIKMPDLYRAFHNNVGKYGRITETYVMSEYGIDHPGDALHNLPVGMKLLRRKRLDLFPQKTHEPQKLALNLTKPKKGK